MAGCHGTNASAQFDPYYLKIFSHRSSVKKYRKTYWVFEPSDLGGYIGCYRWGCKSGGGPLLGKHIVLIGKYAEWPWGSADFSKGLMAIEPDSTFGMLSIFTGSPPPLAHINPKVVSSARSQQQANRCGVRSYCIAVFWGTIGFSKDSPRIGWSARSPYYYVKLEGIKVYDKYTLLSAAKEGAALGWSKALSTIVNSGFQPSQ